MITGKFEKEYDRSICIKQDGPCLNYDCRYHLHSDFTERGELKIRQNADGPTCARNVAALGEQTLETCGQLMGLNKESIRLIELVALHKLKKSAELSKLKEEFISANEVTYPTDYEAFDD